MAESTETEKLSLRLLIDEQKNKVVLAESGKDFVDVLFSFLALPMGTIVRLLEEHRKSPQVVVGCFNNLYKSVSEMGIESFQTEACKQILLYPRSVNLEKYRKIKLKIDDTEAVKYFVCSGVHYRESCRTFYSISNKEECECGEYENSYFVRRLMNWEILRPEKEQVQGSIFRKDNDGVFVSCKACSFIITDDLKVAASSMDYVLNTLRGLGYENSHKLGEILLDVGTYFAGMFIYFGLSFNRHFYEEANPSLQGSGDGAGPGQTITFKAFVRKPDTKILCVECGADFIDLLFTFLALPLESVWDISGDSISLGCIGNLFRSFKSLNEGTDASSSSKSQLPWLYSCPKQLLDVVTEKQEIYCSFNRSVDKTYGYDFKFTRKRPDWKTARFLVTDDLVIKPKNLVSNISLLNLKMHMEKEDVEEQVITIGKLEAISLLRASVITSSALTTCFWSLIAKKAKEEI
ncbi:hypothetical protein ARALYDRAFT_478227 [Arabidopsis lyrata subsp. lyrata]|uniref:DUF674 family protein n=1 Tax=Arabidopsis lyrata subsp. lyrata TaxID=81972 RepID=D7L7S1_ARALL|nr:hypothetical protein ARALYDRAFT_478227 [Arabidopsis lyrata subsp. lyrata]